MGRTFPEKGVRASRRRATAALVAIALAGSAILLPAPSEADPSLKSDGEGRWSGDWEVKGQTQENADLVLFGVITFELLTGDAADGTRQDVAGCEDTDDVYRMSWEFSGGGVGRACEIADFESELYGKYFGNDGSWGQFVNTFVPEDASWRGEYTPPSFDPVRPSDVWLEWEGTRLGSCSAPVAPEHEIGPVDRESSPARARNDRQPECPAGEEQIVSFTFTQGGLPKRHPRALEDVRTVGKGSITFFNPEPANDQLSDFVARDYSGRVVRELEYVFDVDKMTFRIDETDRELTFFQPDVALAGTSVVLDLVAIQSSDSACPKKTKNGTRRTASLGLRDGLNSGTPDIVRLHVRGCDHHNYEFKGKKRVKVAIVHTTPG